VLRPVFLPQSLPKNPKSWNPELGSSVNPQPSWLRYHGSAGFQPAGSGGILPPVHHFQTGSQPRYYVQSQRNWQVSLCFHVV
jgi:hypothetical protein